MNQEILMVILCREEALVGIHLRYHRLAKSVRLVQLRDIGFGDFLLLRRIVKNRRAVLRTAIGTLAIQLRRVMRHREKYLQQFAIADLRRVITDLHRFGMAGIAAAHLRVVRMVFVTAVIA